MRALVAGLAVFAVALVPATALGSTPGLQPGVHVDPGSPAGKEYQIPIAAARGQAAGGSSNGSANPPLFGVGVTPPGGSGGASNATAGSGGASNATAGSGTSASQGSAKAGSARRGNAHSKSTAGGPAGSDPASASPTRQSASALADGARTPGGNGWIALVGGGVLVLVLGGGGGLAIRQRALRG